MNAKDFLRLGVPVGEATAANRRIDAWNPEHNFSLAKRPRTVYL